MKEHVYWTSYGDFHYSPAQIRWLVDNEDFFMTGCWPPEPAGEYLTDRWDKHERRWVDWIGMGGMPDDCQRKLSMKCEAGYCKAKEIYQDVMSRIEAADTHGKLLLAQLRAGYMSLDEEAFNALKYVCGAKPKKISYEKWVWQRGRRCVSSQV
jgi:hypothetical protein